MLKYIALCAGLLCTSCTFSAAEEDPYTPLIQRVLPHKGAEMADVLMPHLQNCTVEQAEEHLTLLKPALKACATTEEAGYVLEGYLKWFSDEDGGQSIQPHDPSYPLSNLEGQVKGFTEVGREFWTILELDWDKRAL